MLRSLFFSTLLISSTLLVGCSRNEEITQGHFLAFGTINDVTIAGVTTAQANAAIAELEKDFEQMHKNWHAWDPGPLTRTNDLIEKGSEFPAPPEVIALTQLAKDLSIKSHDLFNPAIGRLLRLWGFQKSDYAGQQPPDDEKIKEFLAHNPRMSDLEIRDGNIICHNSWVKLDFGAIGKGYGVDKAVEHLKRLGISNAIVNSGGNLRAIGSRNGEPWRIGIRDASGQGNFGRVLIQGDESLSTSANYERYFEWNGKKFGHILDPRTGYPSEGTASVTVIHSDAATADAASTALFIAGPAQWYEVAQSMGLRYVLLVSSDNQVYMSPEMAARVELTNPEAKINISPPLTQKAHAQ